MSRLDQGDHPAFAERSSLTWTSACEESAGLPNARHSKQAPHEAIEVKRGKGEQVTG
jgi:hypothetical protein